MTSKVSTGGSKAPTRRQKPVLDATTKDDTEIRLEKALFGDEAGFLDSLSAAKYGEGKALQLYTSDSEVDAAGQEDEDLADVPDEDVWMPHPTASIPINEI